MTPEISVADPAARTSPPGYRWRCLLRSLARLSTLPLAASFLGYLGDWHWLLDLCSHFRWQYLLLAVIGSLAAMGARQPRLALLLLLGVVANGWSVLTVTGPAQPVPAMAAAPWKLLVVNVHLESRDLAPLLRLIELEAPDVVGIIELSPRTARALSVLDQRFPLHRLEPRDDPFGMGLWSRWPQGRVDLVTTSPLDLPTMQLLGAQPGTPEVWLVHPFPPIGGVATGWRDQHLDFIADRIRQNPDAIVAGDFNATPWSHAYRHFRGATALSDSAAGQLPWPTWSAFGLLGRVLAVPIDHVLHGRHWRVRSFRIGPDIGSDHRPLIVSFQSG
jgi:endonuclease/exonuclease/phosphatase (EEP) superfamily protein YafD